MWPRNSRARPSAVAIAAYVLRGSTDNAAVRYAVTVPGIFGNAGAFAGEVAISFILMTAILFASNRKALTRYTPYVVGVLYATFITFETPLSGMSMNPARTFGSAFRAGYWQAMWIYFHCAYSGHACRRRDFSAGSRGSSSLLCKAKSRQRQALHISTTDLGGASPRFLFLRRHEMKKWKIVVPVVAILLFVAWYAFRPERLLVNRRVQENFPAADTNSSNRAGPRVRTFPQHSASDARYSNRLSRSRRQSRASLHEFQHFERPGCSFKGRAREW